MTTPEGAPERHDSRDETTGYPISPREMALREIAKHILPDRSILPLIEELFGEDSGEYAGMANALDKEPTPERAGFKPQIIAYIDSLGWLSESLYPLPEYRAGEWVVDRTWETQLP